jgi:hypothetical protein
MLLWCLVADYVPSPLPLPTEGDLECKLFGLSSLRGNTDCKILQIKDLSAKYSKIKGFPKCGDSRFNA